MPHAVSDRGTYRPAGAVKFAASDSLAFFSLGLPNCRGDDFEVLIALGARQPFASVLSYSFEIHRVLPPAAGY